MNIYNDEGKIPIISRYLIFAAAVGIGSSFALLTHAVIPNIDNIIQLIAICLGIITLFVPVYLLLERQLFARIAPHLPQFWPPVFTFLLWIIMASGLAVLDRPSKLRSLSRFLSYMERIHFHKEIFYFFHIPCILYLIACFAIWQIWPPPSVQKLKTTQHSDILDDIL